MLILGGIISSAVNKPRVFSPSRTTIDNKIRALSFIPPLPTQLLSTAHICSHTKLPAPEETIVAKITHSIIQHWPDDFRNGSNVGVFLRVPELNCSTF